MGIETIMLKAFEPSHTIQIKALNNSASSVVLVYLIKSTLDKNGYQYISNANETALFIKKKVKSEQPNLN